MHAEMADSITPFNRALGLNAPGMMWNPQMSFGLRQLDAAINHYALQVAYTNDFLFMFYATLLVFVFTWMIRKPQLKSLPEPVLPKSPA